MIESHRTELDDLVDSFACEHHCPSVAWGVIADGELALHGSSGALADDTAPTERTVYRIASMTKSFTAAVVLLLRDEGAFQLDDPIARHAPELAALIGPAEDAPLITIAHLLSMGSGLATDDPWADRHLDITDAELDAVIASGGLFAASPGTAFEYSNLGYALIGRVIKRVSGHRVQDHVSNRLLPALGMKRTTWIMPGHHDWAYPYRHEDGTNVREATPIGDGELAPMGGLWTCVADLTRWISWMDDAFPPRDGPDLGPLSRASRREMHQIHRYAGSKVLAGRGAPTGYGYGLLIRDDPTLGVVVGHSGGLPGYGSNMRWLPGRRLGAVALSNVTYAPMAELTLRMLDQVRDELLQPTGIVTTTQTQIANQLVALLNRWDDGQAALVFADNVDLDESFERRRAAAVAVIDGHGPLHIDRIEAGTGAAATITALDQQRAPVTITFDLAPFQPPRIQFFEVSR